MKKKTLNGKTAVIIGASSGIGKAIALTLAKEGMNLVLAARRESILQEVASECEALGGAAIAVKTDVTNYTDVENLIGKSRTFFGNIDVWINNAGVGSVGEFTETPLSVHEQVIRTNLLGALYGCYAVLPYFKSRRRGTIINTVSLGSYVPSPYASAYSASKFGLRGFTESMRAELSGLPAIHVCDVHPSFTDTPGLIHTANFTGKELRPVPPLYDPFQVADRVLKLIKNPKNSIMVGNSGRLARIVHAVAPNSLENYLALSAKLFFRFQPQAKITQGNVFTPVYEGTEARGGRMKRPSFLKHYFDSTLR